MERHAAQGGNRQECALSGRLADRAAQGEIPLSLVHYFIYDEALIRDRMDRTYWAKVCAWRADARIRVHDLKAEPAARAVPAGGATVVLDPFAIPCHPRFRREHDARVAELAAAASRLYVMVEDTHEHTYAGGPAGVAEFARRFGAQVICTYRSSMALFPGLTVHHLPHHIDTAVHHVRPEVRKEYDIVYYGAGSMRFYAFRRRIEALLRASTLKVCFIPHPGYQVFDPARCGAALSIAINKAWIGICTASKARYLLAKYLEIAMNGAVVAGDMPDAEAERLWSGNYIALAETMSDAQIIAALSHALADKRALEAKVAAMRERLEPFTLEHVARHLLEVVGLS